MQDLSQKSPFVQSSHLELVGPDWTREPWLSCPFGLRSEDNVTKMKVEVQLSLMRCTFQRGWSRDCCKVSSVPLGVPSGLWTAWLCRPLDRGCVLWTLLCCQWLQTSRKPFSSFSHCLQVFQATSSLCHSVELLHYHDLAAPLWWTIRSFPILLLQWHCKH